MSVEVLGIDFGTSNTVAVLAGGGRPPRVLSIDGNSWMPSAVYVDDDDSLAVGRDAERKARLAPERFEPNPKRRIDDGEILLGVRVVPVVDAIAAVLGRVGEEARRQLNGRNPDEVHLTHPAQWGSARQNVLLTAARAAGLGGAITLLPEPVGAAAHFASLPGNALPPGSALAVYDLGGGTFDCAVVGSTPSGYTVLAEAGLPDVGGVDFDQTILDHLGRTAAAADPGRWQSLTSPRTAGERRSARSLREDIRAAKETLSRYSQTDLPLPEPFEDTLLTRRELDGLIRPAIVRTVELLAATIERAGVSPQRLAGVYLVGGSSRIPLVATVISDKLGIVASTLDQPETSVALGAALTPGTARPSGRTESLGPQSGPRPPIAGPGARPAGSVPPIGPPQPGSVTGPQRGAPGPVRPGAPTSVPPGVTPRAGGRMAGPPPAASTSGPQPGRPLTGPYSGGPSGTGTSVTGPSGARPPGPSSSGPHPARTVTGPTRSGPTVSGPHPVPGSGSTSGRRRGLAIGISAALAAIVAIVTVVLIITNGSGSAGGGDGPTTSSSGAASSATSDPRTSDTSASSASAAPPAGPTVPATCQTAPIDNNGMTPCMIALAGPNADRATLCGPVPRDDPDMVEAFGSVDPMAASGCTGLQGGRVTVIYAQFDTTEQAIKAFDGVVTDLSQQSWRSGNGGGRFALNGQNADGPQIYWSYSGLAVVGFAVSSAPDGSSLQPLTLDQLTTFWRESLLPQQ
jgi:actin-like ATPase involved in cell morphogenesis